ncbi:MAG: hypothetical protein AAB600_02065 [Patescibacteria group bacterium]
MIGYFDAEDGKPKVVLSVKGTKRKEKQLTALFDTGHSGSLSLPIFDLIEIGAKLASIGRAQYADGRIGIDYLFSVKVKFNGIEKEVEASMIQNPQVTQAIAGVQLFSPFIALIDFRNKKLNLIKENDLRKKL